MNCKGKKCGSTKSTKSTKSQDMIRNISILLHKYVKCFSCGKITYKERCIGCQNNFFNSVINILKSNSMFMSYCHYVDYLSFKTGPVEFGSTYAPENGYMVDQKDAYRGLVVININHRVHKDKDGDLSPLRFIRHLIFEIVNARDPLIRKKSGDGAFLKYKKNKKKAAEHFAITMENYELESKRITNIICHSISTFIPKFRMHKVKKTQKHFQHYIKIFNDQWGSEYNKKKSEGYLTSTFKF